MRILFKILSKIQLILHKAFLFFYLLIFKRTGKNVSIVFPMYVKNPEYIVIGNNVSILHNLRIECVDKWNNIYYSPRIVISDGVNVEQNVHITSGSGLFIGRNTSILANVCITNIIHEYKDITKSPKFNNISCLDIYIGDNCMICTNSVILPGTYIGDHCIVGANSVVKGIFESYSVIVGTPAKIIKKYNHNQMLWERYSE